MFKVKLTLDRKNYEMYIKSIEPELTETFGRSRVYETLDKNNIYINIEAPDVPSFKASISSIARVLNVAKKILEGKIW